SSGGSTRSVGIPPVYGFFRPSRVRGSPSRAGFRVQGSGSDFGVGFGVGLGVRSSGPFGSRVRGSPVSGLSEFDEASAFRAPTPASPQPQTPNPERVLYPYC